MSQLEKAILKEVKSDRNSTPVEGSEVPVQFNPATLKLKLTNRIEGGRSKGRQTRQYVGASSNVLTLDLVFDTADEGTTDNPRSVLERTEIIEKFIKPKRQRGASSEKPPKLCFQWGNLIIVGMVESVDLELDHFASNGVPLRAKATVSIKQQEIEIQFKEADEGQSKPPRPGEDASGAVGRSADGNNNQSAKALGNESAPEFAARMGLDPAAWRGLELGIDLSAGLSLEAGIDVGFSADLSIGLGLGVTVGVEAGVDVSLEAAFGLEASVGVSAGVGATAGASFNADLSAGFALAASGGINAAVESVQIVKATAAIEATRSAFDAPATTRNSAAVHSAPSSGATGRGAIGDARVGSPATLAPRLPQQPRTPLSVAGAGSSLPRAAAPAPLPPQADARSTTFGFGVPLRPRVVSAVDERRGVVVGSTAQVVEGELVFTDNPTIPPWEQLPSRDTGRAVADSIQQQRRPGGTCGCTLH